VLNRRSADAAATGLRRSRFSDGYDRDEFPPIGALLRAAVQARDTGWMLAFTRPPGHVARVLTRLGIDASFPFAPD
jgi:hypothetical protein